MGRHDGVVLQTMRLRLERGMEKIQKAGELPADTLRIIAWQPVKEVHRSKLSGYQNIAMRIYPKGVTPECFNRGSSSGLAWIPDKAFGNDRC